MYFAFLESKNNSSHKKVTNLEEGQIHKMETRSRASEIVLQLSKIKPIKLNFSVYNINVL